MTWFMPSVICFMSTSAAFLVHGSACEQHTPAQLIDYSIMFLPSNICYNMFYYHITCIRGRCFHRQGKDSICFCFQKKIQIFKYLYIVIIEIFIKIFCKKIDQKINCGFVRGPKESPSTGFDLGEDDSKYLSSCHIAVLSCIFGNSDRLRVPTGRTVWTLVLLNFVCLLSGPCALCSFLSPFFT